MKLMGFYISASAQFGYEEDKRSKDACGMGADAIQSAADGHLQPSRIASEALRFRTI